MSASLDALIPELRQPAHELVNLGGRAGVSPRVTSTVRTHSQQQRLYDAYLRGETQYPVAPPGRSAHEWGYAFDMVADTRENLHDLGQVWVSWGGVWSLHDEVHFEYPGFSAPSSAPTGRAALVEGGAIYQLADFLSGFVPGLGEVQIVDSLANLFGTSDSVYRWYLQHPAEALRDLVGLQP